MAAADTIHISNLRLATHVGVTEEERAQPQQLTVSLTLHSNEPFSVINDEIERTTNYAEVCNSVCQLAAARPRRLIETLAEDIANHVLCGSPLCAEVEVELRKFILPETDYVAVRLSRKRVNQPQCSRLSRQ